MTTPEGTPEGQVRMVAQRLSIRYDHAVGLIDENLCIGDSISGFCESRDIEIIPIQNGYLRFIGVWTNGR